VLASGSPRRREILAMLGFDVEVDVPHVDESSLPGEGAHEHVERLARAKAERVAARHPGRWVLAGDTVVVVDGDLLGKPADTDEAAAMVARLAGRAHEVSTALALVAPDGTLRSGVSTTEVRFRDFGPELARAYAATGEPLDKAGAYGIQGRGAALVRSVRGDYYAVVGLPVSLLLDLLEAAGARFAFTEGSQSHGG